MQVAIIDPEFERLQGQGQFSDSTRVISLNVMIRKTSFYDLILQYNKYTVYAPGRLRTQKTWPTN